MGEEVPQHSKDKLILVVVIVPIQLGPNPFQLEAQEQRPYPLVQIEPGRYLILIGKQHEHSWAFVLEHVLDLPLHSQNSWFILDQEVQEAGRQGHVR